MMMLRALGLEYENQVPVLIINASKHSEALTETVLSEMSEKVECCFQLTMDLRTLLSPIVGSDG